MSSVERLLQLSETFQFRIYPDLNIEQEMENKVSRSRRLKL
jgi:hypothetical protein